MTDQLSGGVVQPTDAQINQSDFLVQIWGEDITHPLSVIVPGWDGVRAFCIQQYTGSADDTHYDGTLTLDAIKDNFDEEDERQEHRATVYEEEWEIGGLRIQRVIDCALAVPQAPLQAEPVTVVASDSHVRAVLLSYHSNNLTEDEAVRLLATPQAEPAVAEQAREVADADSAMDEIQQIVGEDTDVLLSDEGSARVYGVLEQLENASHKVPREPTQAMLQAAENWNAKGWDWPKAIWRAMWDAALASQSTPPPESAGLTDAQINSALAAWFSDCGSFEERMRCAILAANPTAQPDGGSKA